MTLFDAYRVLFANRFSGLGQSMRSRRFHFSDVVSGANRRSALKFAGLVMLALVTLLVTLTAPLVAADWKAAAARINITPEKLMWMSGYGSRDRPAEGKLTDLWAKALVLEDPDGKRAVWITLDLVGIDRQISLDVLDRYMAQYGLEPAQVAFCTSHTHTGPVVGKNLKAMYFLDAEQWRLVDEYTDSLKDKLVKLAGDALARLEPAQLSWANGRATFAVNRRNNRAADVPRLRAEGQLQGPFDHDVPVLAVKSAEGELRALLFGYACHATVLSFYKWSGDYPGFAQIALEEKHPGCVAMFWAGCGADQNPLPRRQVEQAQKYGQRLAAAVDRVLEGEMNPIYGKLSTRRAEIDLPFDKLPTREQLENEKSSSNRYYARRAVLLLEKLDRDGTLSPTYPYPIQVWRLGPELVFTALGGEVVVDYALRLKAELGQQTTWVAGYSNDVMAYIPSRRVLNEGGYEGGGAMVYYGLPTVWAPEVEELIVDKVHELVQAKR